MNFIRPTIAAFALTVALVASPAAAQAAPNDVPAHDAFAQRFGTFDCRAVCGEKHASTGGNVWIGPKRLTMGGANIDAASHWAGYLT